MKKLFLSTFALSVIFTFSANADYTRGHFRSNGSYVSGYHRTSSDSLKFNNYSTKGNINPYTGKRGYKSPYKF